MIVVALKCDYRCWMCVDGKICVVCLRLDCVAASRYDSELGIMTLR